MDKKSKVFLWVFFLLIAGSVAVTYWRIMIKKDYIIEAQADCDPTTEKCFVQQCDPSAGDDCTGDAEKDTSYFKKVSRLAYNIPLCDPADENCKALECGEGEKDCTVTYCDDSTKGKDDECSDPDQYNADHPQTSDDQGDGGDQSVTCDPDSDQDCPADSADGGQSSDSGDSSDSSAQ